VIDCSLNRMGLLSEVSDSVLLIVGDKVLFKNDRGAL
jgi:hypothetical protein